MTVFDKFAPFIQDYIYRHEWTELREVQLEAARVIFDTDDNLLLTSQTASGKTEAAFFPIISQLCEDIDAGVKGFGALYIAPLKSLINDQFSRLDELLDMSGIPVFHWHGDVAASHKNKAALNPQGILQITPESLEGMLMNRSNDVVRMFANLRFVVIDEMHILCGTDRGNQILCQLIRMGHLIGRHPRRVGLSATVGDVTLAAKWLGAGSGRETQCPIISPGKLRWKLGLEHFYIQNPNPDQSGDIPTEVQEQCDLDPGYEYVYDCVRDKKCLIFSNSREETEYICATMRQIAKSRGDIDRFLIHHGNLSAALREEAELRLKDDEQSLVTCATVTLELGVDIGRLERVVQIDSPNTVSSLLQRLGRSGRRGDPPEMMMVFREENPLPNTPLPQLIPWGLLRAIAIVQLYIEERFIEPPSVPTLPFSLMFQQTLSVLNASGELSAKRLAERVMNLPPFEAVSKEDYKALLVSMIRHDFIQLTETGGLIVGMKGERLTNSYRFLAVFKDSEDYTVRCESDEIGTITTPPPVGDRFALAGRVWEVEELDIPRKLIYVKLVEGKMEISWPGDFGEIHTKILQRMRRVLEEDTVYPYLKRNAQKRLEVARNIARNTGMLERSLVHLGGYSWCLFPWLGTRSFRTLRKMLPRSGVKLTGLEFEGCYYMTFRLEGASDVELVESLCARLRRGEFDRYDLAAGGNAPAFEKYDEFIPDELLRKAYAADRLRLDEVEWRLPQILEELR